MVGNVSKNTFLLLLLKSYDCNHLLNNNDCEHKKELLGVLNKDSLVKQEILILDKVKVGCTM